MDPSYLENVAILVLEPSEMFLHYLLLPLLLFNNQNIHSQVNLIASFYQMYCL